MMLINYHEPKPIVFSDFLGFHRMALFLFSVSLSKTRHIRLSRVQKPRPALAVTLTVSCLRRTRQFGGVRGRCIVGFSAIRKYKSGFACSSSWLPGFCFVYFEAPLSAS